MRRARECDEDGAVHFISHVTRGMRLALATNPKHQMNFASFPSKGIKRLAFPTLPRDEIKQIQVMAPSLFFHFPHHTRNETIQEAFYHGHITFHFPHYARDETNIPLSHAHTAHFHFPRQMRDETGYGQGAGLLCQPYISCQAQDDTL